MSKSKLALLGGKPVGGAKIPKYPHFEKTAIKKVVEVLETGRTDEIIKKVMPKRQIAIQLVTPAQPAVNLIAAHPGVSNVNAAGATVRFMFEGRDPDLAKLNASLVAAGVGVALLTEGKTTLHELYFAITERSPVAPPS